MITHTRTGIPIIGVSGYKNSGKTTLVANLVAHLTAAGHRVSTVKHAHHTADVDRPNTDSMAHRLAGAGQVLLVTPKRLALMEEFSGAEPPFADIIDMIGPCDLLIVEGYKRENIPKLLMLGDGGAPAPSPDGVVAKVQQAAATTEGDLPVFCRSDISAIADFIVDYCQVSSALPRAKTNGP